MAEALKKNRRGLGDVGKPVVQRWTKMKMNQKARALGRMLARRRIIRAEREHKKVLEQTFQTIKHYATKNEHGRFPAVTILMNIGLYLMLAYKDIQALKIDALTHPDDWTRKLHARVILLIIYEWDADSVSGRALKDSLELMLAPDDLKAEVFTTLRTLRSVHQKATKQFTGVRNTAIGHRDANALLQYRAIRDLKVADVWSLAIEFSSGIEKFIRVLTKLSALGGSMPSLLNQWTVTEKNTPKN